jgi:hypothetical protein
MTRQEKGDRAVVYRWESLHYKWRTILYTNYIITVYVRNICLSSLKMIFASKRVVSLKESMELYNATYSFPIPIYIIQTVCGQKYWHMLKKSLCNQPKPYFFKKLLWSNFWVDFNKFYTKTFRIVYILIVYLLIMFIWVVFICTLFKQDC